MKGLLYKEFTAAKSSIIIIAIIQLILSGIIIFAAMIGSTGMDMVWPAVLCYFLAFTLSRMLEEVYFRNDEKRPWCNFVSALPQTAKGQVACKYFTILIIYLMILFFCFLTDWIVIAITGDISVSTVMIVVIIFCWQLIRSAIDVPFMIRFGSTSGTVVKGIAIAGLILIVGIYFLFGDISFLFEENIADKIMTFFKSPNVIWIVALIPYITFGMYYLSYRISLKLYQKGAENYEQ